MKTYEYIWVNWNEDRLTTKGKEGWRVVPGCVDGDTVLMEREITDGTPEQRRTPGDAAREGKSQLVREHAEREGIPVRNLKPRDPRHKFLREHFRKPGAQTSPLGFLERLQQSQPIDYTQPGSLDSTFDFGKED